VLLEARLGSVRIPLQIDVGFGDAIVPAPEKLEFPTLRKASAPKLKTSGSVQTSTSCLPGKCPSVRKIDRSVLGGPKVACGRHRG
jgi:hypothetical protein